MNKKKLELILMRYSPDRLVDLEELDEILILISQAEKEAVGGFFDYLGKKGVLSDEYWEEGPSWNFDWNRLPKDYLSSIGKEDNEK